MKVKFHRTVQNTTYYTSDPTRMRDDLLMRTFSCLLEAEEVSTATLKFMISKRW